MSKRGYKASAQNGKAVLEIDPDNKTLQDETHRVVRVLQETIKNHADLKDDQVSLIAVTLALEFLKELCYESIEQQILAPKGQGH